MAQRTRRNGRNPAMAQRSPADAPVKLQQQHTGLPVNKPVVNPYGMDTDVNVNPEACMGQTSIFNHPMGTRLYHPPELNHVFRPDLAFPPGIHNNALWQQVQQVPYIPNQQAWAQLADPNAVWVPQAVPKKVWQSTPERQSGWPVDQPAFLVVPEPQKCPPGCPPESPVPPPPQPQVPPPPQPPSTGTGEKPGAGDAAAARAARRKRRKAERAPSAVPVKKPPAKPVQPIPVDENGVEKLPSKGSEGHAQKKCRPCHYIHTKAGCSNGEDCGFCHMKHSKRSRPRLPKHQCLQCRNYAQLVFDDNDEANKTTASVHMLMMMTANPRLAAYASSVLRSLRGGAKLRLDRTKGGGYEPNPAIVELVRKLEQQGQEDDEDESDEEGGSEEEDDDEEEEDDDDEEGEEEASENASREEEASTEE